MEIFISCQSEFPKLTQAALSFRVRCNGLNGWGWFFVLPWLSTVMAQQCCSRLKHVRISWRFYIRF